VDITFFIYIIIIIDDKLSFYWRSKI